MHQQVQRDTWEFSQWEEWQASRLADFLHHAVKNVPYYRKLWDGIYSKNPKASHLKLSDWPILEKSEIRNSPQAFIADNYRSKKLYNIHTSGTSGTPMSFWFDREALSLWYAMYEHRIKKWNGVSDKDRWANIGGQLICPISQNKPPFWVWNAAMRQLYLSSYHITPQNTAHYARALLSHKVKYLLGYVSSIYNIARESIAQNLELPKLKVVITNAEPLLDHQREVISTAFGCPVVQTYSGCEFAFGGNEDLTGSMYLWPEAGVLEVVDANDQVLLRGQVGNFVATGLVNKAMPLVRYRVGDSGALKGETPGDNGKRPFLELQEVTGRNDDLIYTSDGRMVGRLDPVFKADYHIREAQIIQEDLQHINILVVPFDGFTESEAVDIRQRLLDRVGATMNVDIQQVESIPRSSNGKFKAVISKVKK